MVLSDGVGETTMSESPAVRAICSSCVDRRPPIPFARHAALTWRNASCAIPGRRCGPSAGQRTERDAAGVDVVLDRAHVGLDGVFALTHRVPARRAEFAMPRDELSAMLVVEHADAFPTVDLDDARQLGPAQPSELDCGSLRLTLAHGLFVSSGPWPAAPG